jgi:hypothetical protein
LSQDNPNIDEILLTVKEFAEAVAQRSQGAERYDALCAAFLVGVVQRELTLGEQQDQAQRIKLKELTGVDGDLAGLYQVFCQHVRAGKFDDNWQPAFEFALGQVIDKVAVTNPSHLEREHQAHKS